MTNRRVTTNNIKKIIKIAKKRDYIENQGFREQKVTMPLGLEHVYSKNINAIYFIYTILQLVHVILQIIEHSKLVGDFKKTYGSMKVYTKKLYAKLIEIVLEIEELLEYKIQIRYN